MGNPGVNQGRSLRKVGLDFGLISGAEWLVIVAAFLGRYLLQFYQTSIWNLAESFGMNSFEAVSYTHLTLPTIYSV